jgi:hypothetical protein
MPVRLVLADVFPVDQRNELMLVGLAFQQVSTACSTDDVDVTSLPSSNDPRPV